MIKTNIWSKKALSFLLTMAMIFAVLPRLVLPAYAADGDPFRVSGGDTYTTLEDAVAAVPDGGMITMLKEVTVAKSLYTDNGIVLNENKSYTIDFGGYALRSGDNSRIKYCLLSIEGGSVHLKNGTIRANRDFAQNYDTDAVYVSGSTTNVDISNMNIIGSINAISVSLSKVTIWSGEFSTIITPANCLYIENGEINPAEGSTFSWETPAKLTVTSAQAATPPTISAYRGNA